MKDLSHFSHFRRFDAAEFLDDAETVLAYLEGALDEDDPDIFLNALKTAARAKGMTKIAEATGLGRESLYKALQPGSKVRFETIQKLLNALGLRLTVEPVDQKRSAAE